MCGIAGAYALRTSEPKQEIPAIINMLLARLQNRGDLSSGMGRYNPAAMRRLKVEKGRGRVADVFGESGSYKNRQAMERMQGVAAIGHNRYATSGQTTDDEAIRNYAQPYFREHNRKWKEFAFGFNGNITNLDELYDKYLADDTNNYYLKTSTDTEYIKIYLAIKNSELTHQPGREDFVKIWREFSENFDGAYCVTYLDSNGNLIAVRDPMGFHPLFYVERDGMLLISSEDSPLRALDFQDAREVPPGHMLWCNGEDYWIIPYTDSPRRAHCIFEHIYFMNAASTFAGRSVQKARGALGHKLADTEPDDIIQDNTVTAPVPGTAIGMCDGYQQGIHEHKGKFLPRYDALVKVSESRSFISDFSYNTRDQVIRNKFDLTPGYLEGKELVLIDDSIVRGSTSKKLIKYLRDETKATKIHMRSAGSPIRFPCFYGINMPTLAELIAADNKPEEKVSQEIGADTTRYNTVEDMVEAVAGSTELKREDFCLGCFTGTYPTAGGQQGLEKLLDDSVKKSESR